MMLKATVPFDADQMQPVMTRNNSPYISACRLVNGKRTDCLTLDYFQNAARELLTGESDQIEYYTIATDRLYVRLNWHPEPGDCTEAAIEHAARTIARTFKQWAAGRYQPHNLVLTWPGELAA